MITGFTCRSAGCIPESAGFMTSRVCDWDIVMVIVRYLCCSMAKSAVILGSTSISRFWESRAYSPLCSSYVSVATPKAGGGFSFC